MMTSSLVSAGCAVHGVIASSFELPRYSSGVAGVVAPDEVRIAEVVATLSYAADLGLGQPMAHCMRQTVLALRLADLAGATPAEREATYYLGLMMNAYCHADASRSEEHTS